MNLLTISLLVLFSISAIVVLTSKLKLNAFVSLLLVSIFLAIAAIPGADVIKIIKEGFGNTMASIGFLIILGAMIAVILDKTGGALSIARYILSKTGEKNAAAALGITGFIAGMPIFCDSGYIILSGLAKSFSSRTKIAMPLIASVLACSLYSVHCLIPPHPGALAAAGIINVPVGNLILMGILFAVPGALAAFLWITWLTKGKDYPLANETKINHHLTEIEVPAPLLSFLPIVTPLLMITLNSLFGILFPGSQNLLVRAIVFTGQPVIALMIGVLLSFPLIQNKGVAVLNGIFDSAIEKAGPILIVTAAGGMFGAVIKETGIGTEAGTLLSKTGLGLAVPFLIACLMKTAQGSSTVAIITTASFVVPMLEVLGLDSEWGRMFTMLAMGAGSMMISHANDSYFWVITKFSDIHADVTLRVYSTATVVMGLVVFICAWLTSLLIL
jgi:GntP family gluconate:H+ symporter